jgi:hypothetical protein
MVVLAGLVKFVVSVVVLSEFKSVSIAALLQYICFILSANSIKDDFNDNKNHR